MVIRNGVGEWDCRNISRVPHSSVLVHEREHEDGLPNYHVQKEFGLSVTICERCHPRIPGHLIDRLTDSVGIGPVDMQPYFEIEQTDELFSELPEAYSSTGKSRKERIAIFRYAMHDRVNPHRDHAGRTLRVSLGYQWDIDDWKPADEVLQPIWKEYEETRGNYYKKDGSLYE